MNDASVCKSIKAGSTYLLRDEDTAKHSSAQPPLFAHGPPGGCRWGENTRTSLKPSTCDLMTVTSVPLYLFALRIDLRFQVVQYTNWLCTVMAYGWSMAEPMTETTLPWGCKNFTKRWWMINCFPTLYGFVPGVKNRRARKEKKTVGVTKRIINERKGSHHLRESNTGHGTERRML